MSYKLIFCEVEGCYSDPEDCCDATVNFRELTLASLVNLTTNYHLREDLLALLKGLLESGDERVAQVLQEAGLVNVEKIKSREDKLVVSKQYWVVSKERYGCSSPIDIDNIPRHLIHDLASDKTQVVQVITKPSMKKLLSPEQKEIYDREVKRLKAQKEKNAAVAKKRKETKKQKELEKAKKLLEDAGELGK